MGLQPNGDGLNTIVKNSW